jgi:hypothetical protein
MCYTKQTFEKNNLINFLDADIKCYNFDDKFEKA